MMSAKKLFKLAFLVTVYLLFMYFILQSTKEDLVSLSLVSAMFCSVIAYNFLDNRSSNMASVQLKVSST